MKHPQNLQDEADEVGSCRVCLPSASGTTEAELRNLKRILKKETPMCDGMTGYRSLPLWLPKCS